MNVCACCLEVNGGWSKCAQTDLNDIIIFRYAMRESVTVVARLEDALATSFFYKSLAKGW